MSEMGSEEKGLHILLGISGLDEKLLKQIKDEFAKSHKNIGICAIKYQLLAVEQYVAEHRDTDILIVSEYLQQSKPYTIPDYEKLNDLNSRMVIVPILQDVKKGTLFMAELLNLGIYNAVFESNADIKTLVDIVFSGRTRTEAKYYYGTETVNDIGTTANISTCVDHISFGGEKENTKERADYIRSRLSEKDFEVVMSKIPKDVSDKLRLFDDYSQFFEGSVAQPQKKVNFTERLNKLAWNQNEVEEISLVVKPEVQSAVKKVVVGFAGAQAHVGNTHQTILFSNYLSSAGYSVAIVENEANESRSFFSIFEKYNVKSKGDYFTFADVDYYPSFNLNEMHKLFLKDYNFILVDFGIYNEFMQLEFGRCVVQIVISGAKPWEQLMLQKLMLLVGDEEILKRYNYLFISAPESARKEIAKDMGLLDKVFFADYQADAFVSEGYPAIRGILENYLPEGEKNRKGQLLGVIKKLFE